MKLVVLLLALQVFYVDRPIKAGTKLLKLEQKLMAVK
jgi:hypothetical protein